MFQINDRDKFKIVESFKKFNINLKDRIVLTEAASGYYVCTMILAALGGANVIAFTKDSKYASATEVILSSKKLLKEFNLETKVSLTKSFPYSELPNIDVLTNTGFIRPINEEKISFLKQSCVIPLMWEPWEYRSDELDLEACNRRLIKVYGTNEEDKRLRTKDYIGYIALKKLLEEKISPFSSKVLVLGSKKFTAFITKVLTINGYDIDCVFSYESKLQKIDKYSAIIVAEHENDICLIGKNGFLKFDDLDQDTPIIHISGNVETEEDQKHNIIPQKPAGFGYMSFTCDFIDSAAVFDLHAAGLKVAEGMLKANELGLDKDNYKLFMENNYPAISFEAKRYW